MAKQRQLIKNCLRRVANVAMEELNSMIEEELTKEKRLWARDWLKRRPTHGASALLFKELAMEDAREYKAALRMPLEHFNNLLAMIAPMITKKDTLMREAIPPELKLEVTLTFLATGNSYRSLSHMFRVSKPAISQFVPEVCAAIYESLKDFIKTPNNHQEWRVIINGFQERWNIPNCCGAIDGKHVMIEAPPNSGSEYYNYKGCHSVILLAVVDHNYCFNFTEVGHKGSENDGGVFSTSSLWLPLENGLLPDGCFLVGDDAFPLKPYLMKPYSVMNRALTVEERIFNYRLSRARRIVENAFGILVSRFRALDKKLVCHVSKVPMLVSAVCSLHNWLRITSPNTYLPQGSVDEENTDTGVVIPGKWRMEVAQLRNLEPFGGRRTTILSKKIRDRLQNYFNNEGAVPWQNNFV